MPDTVTSLQPLSVGISGSPSATSRSRLLVEHVLGLLKDRGWTTRLIDLAKLPAEPLLARSEHPQTSDALASVQEARIMVVGTPVYRATYTGLLKAFFDLMPTDFLVGKVAVLIATGAALGHLLAIDHGLRPLVASLGGLSASTSIYATIEDFVDEVPGPQLAERLARAADEAARIAVQGGGSAGRPTPD